MQTRVKPTQQAGVSHLSFAVDTAANDEVSDRHDELGPQQIELLDRTRVDVWTLPSGQVVLMQHLTYRSKNHVAVSAAVMAALNHYRAWRELVRRQSAARDAAQRSVVDDLHAVQNSKPLRTYGRISALASAFRSA